MPKITVDAKTIPTAEQIGAFHAGLANATRVNASYFVDTDVGELGNNCYYFSKAQSFTYNGMRFAVSQNFLCQKTNEDVYRCHFVGSEVGEGSFAKVYQVEAVMDVTPTSYRPYGGYAQANVIKEQDHCNCTYQTASGCDFHNPIHMLKAEYASSVKVPYLGMEQPQLVRKKWISSYTIMAQMPGTEFLEILLEDEKEISILSLEQRMDLSLELYRALKQISDLRLVHRDLKPENIMVVMEKPIQVRIVDYGFAKILPDDQQTIKVRDYCGTASYVSPEMLEESGSKAISFATDLYSLTRVLLILWGGFDKSFSGRPRDHMFFMNQTSSKLIKLFATLPEEQITDLYKFDLGKDIRRIFAQGLDKNQQLRGTVEEAMTKFEAIYLKYKRAIQPVDMLPSKAAAAEEVDGYNSAAKACAALGRPQSPRVEPMQSQSTVYYDFLPAVVGAAPAGNEQDTFQWDGARCTAL